MLIELSEGIGVDAIRESAIAYIIRNLTVIGVEKRSRDFLQRGIGLASNIQGQHTRSEALFAVIEAASLLAVRQSDLDLLRRMRTWSTSLLEKEYATSAIGKIVQGMIRYALTEKTPYALDEAGRLLGMIDDPVLRQQLMERVIEAYIRVGCLRLEESVSTYQSADFADEARPFQQALALIREHTKPSQVSLRIAGAIDIVLQYAERSSAINFFVPLTLFSLEIDNPLERDAMISRIATGLREIVELLDSTDPYEVLAYLLMRLDQAETSALIMDLACQLNDQIKDPYTKLSGMATLADLFMRQDRRERADQMIDGILVRLDRLPYLFQRVLILADIATLIVGADETRAYECLERAITAPSRGRARPGLVRPRPAGLSIVSLYAVNHSPDNVPRAMAIVEGIENPEDYIEALIAVSNMVRDDTGSCRNILRLVSRSIEAIPNPYERGTALLNVIPIAEVCGEHSYVDVFLAEVDRAMERINIPFIVAVLKRALVQRLVAIAQRRDVEQFTARAIEVARGIEDEDVRHETLQRLNQDPLQTVADSTHAGVLDAKRKIRSGDFSKNLIAGIDRSLHAVPGPRAPGKVLHRALRRRQGGGPGEPGREAPPLRDQRGRDHPAALAPGLRPRGHGTQGLRSRRRDPLQRHHGHGRRGRDEHPGVPAARPDLRRAGHGHQGHAGTAGMRTVEVLIAGRVQGVGFRACVKRIADSLIVTGEVMNLADGRVRIIATTEDVILEKFVSMLYGCPRAIIREVRMNEGDARAFAEFAVRKGLF